MEKQLTFWEQVNQTKEIFLCLTENEEGEYSIELTTDDKKRAQRFCQFRPNSFYSNYPVNTYSEN